MPILYERFFKLRGFDRVVGSLRFYLPIPNVRAIYVILFLISDLENCLSLLSMMSINTLRGKKKILKRNKNYRYFHFPEFSFMLDFGFNQRKFVITVLCLLLSKNKLWFSFSWRKVLILLVNFVCVEKNTDD